MGNTDGVTEDHGFGVAAGLDIDPADQLRQLPCLGATVRPLCVDGFAYKVERHELPRILDAG